MRTLDVAGWTLRRELRRPGVAVIVLVVPLVGGLVGWREAKYGLSAVVVLSLLALLVAGAGILGGELARGEAALLLARPIPRHGYVLGRHAGHVAIVAMASLGGTLAASLAARQAPADAAEALVVALAGLLDHWKLACLVLLLSSFLRGPADVLAVVAAWMVAGLVQRRSVLADPVRSLVQAVEDELLGFTAHESTQAWLDGMPLDALGLLRPAAVGLVALCIAVAVYSRRDLGIRT